MPESAYCYRMSVASSGVSIGIIMVIIMAEYAYCYRNSMAQSGVAIGIIIGLSPIRMPEAAYC